MFIEALNACKLFKDVGDKDLTAIAGFCQAKRFNSGEIVFKENDPGDGMYIVTRGRVQIAATADQEKPQVLSHFGPGDFFGEMAVLDNMPRSATATVETETELAFIPRDGLMEMLQLSSRFALNLVIEFSLRFRDFNRQHINQMLQAERLSLVGRFARSIVHDFKNPMAIISLAADLGGTPNASQEMRNMARERIRKQVDRLSNMINELLEFTRGSQTLNVLAITNFARFAVPLVEEIRQESIAHRVDVLAENEPPSIELAFDPRRLTNVFYNLVHNAVEAMPAGGKVFIRFKELPEHLAVEIEDTGPGISPQIAEHLFEPFATHGKTHGTGLGLSICQRIIQDHKGTIEAISFPGRGALFSFKLPLPKPVI